MTSQYSKRRAKSAEDVASEITSKRDQMRAKATDVKAMQEANPDMGMQEAKAAVEAAYTHQGFDIYTKDGGKTYNVAEISYNPDTGAAQVINTFTISRLIALSYGNQKIALQTLKKGK